MRITEAAGQLGTSPRMLRYRESLGLLPRGRPGGVTNGHRQYGSEDVAAVRLALDLEKTYDVSPAALAFGLRVLAEPAVAAELRELAERLGRIAPPATRAADLERERALRWLGRSGMLPPPRPSPPTRRRPTT